MLTVATLQVRLKGDFLFAPDTDGNFSEALTLDADNMGGHVGIDRVRGGSIAGGKNPSGNLTQGGDFESWLRLTLFETVTGMTPPDRSKAAAFWAALRNRPEDLPVSINLATSEQLEIAGFSRAQANRIVEARRQQPFTQDADLIARGRVSAQLLSDIGDRIVLL